MAQKSCIGIVGILIQVALCGLAMAAESVTIGAVQSITGGVAYAGGQIDAGLQDAINIANEEGGINGKKISYIREDGEDTPDVALNAFKHILSEHRPLIMYGDSAELSKAVAPNIRTQYKILYSSASMSAKFADVAMNPYMFVPGPTDGDMLGILLKYIARTTPGAKVALFYSDSAFGRDPIPFGRIMCRRLRLKLVGEVTAPVDAIDVAPQVKSLRDKGPDYVIIHGFFLDPVKAIIGQSRVLGFKPTFAVTFWAASKELLRRMGTFAKGLIAVSPYMYWWNDDVSMIQKIRAYHKQHYPYVEFRENWYMQGFMTGLIFVECLRRADGAGKLNGDGLVEALRSFKDFETGGLSAPLTIKNNRFPVARIWKANVEKEIFEPLSDWIRLDRFDRN